MPERVATRFWLRTERTPACWLWTGTVGQHGYGAIWDGRRPATAHRLSWRIHNGAVPPGLQVHHHCDNRLCVRPDHLWLGTQRDNMADARIKGRMPTKNGRPKPVLPLARSFVEECVERAGGKRHVWVRLGVHSATLNRWIAADRIPDTWAAVELALMLGGGESACWRRVVRLAGTREEGAR